MGDTGEVEGQTHKTAPWITFILGKQAMLGQDAPRGLRSISVARHTREASVQARTLGAAQLPKITDSYSSSVDNAFSASGNGLSPPPAEPLPAGAVRLTNSLTPSF
jgi:hypothetical protein